ncbi:hypothetical protein ACLOJK_016461, partial [Asimina triloba]
TSDKLLSAEHTIAVKATAAGEYGVNALASWRVSDVASMPTIRVALTGWEGRTLFRT